jgi:endonuclease VIII
MVAEMPEGHTIHRIARDHCRLLCSHALAVSSPQGRFAADAALVNGVVLDDIEAFGKHLFYRWANGLVGHVHLGLFGKFRISRGAEPPVVRGEVRMRLISPAATIDLSGPTACTIGTIDDRDAIVDRLGPDPLRRSADAALAKRKIGSSRTPIGTLLLDQRVLAGVGNVYRAEALFVNGIHPDRPGNQCTPPELDALWMTIVAMLRQGVKDNRIITVDRRELELPAGRRVRRGEATYVYHRDRCLRCGSGILTSDLGGRPCYYCPTCQPH